MNPHTTTGVDGGAAAAPASPVTASSDHELAVTIASEFAAYTDSDAVTVITPAAAATVADASLGWSAHGSYLADIVSAASVDIVSTASQHWNEVRQAGTLGATYKPRSVGVGLDAAVSSEPDYLSLSGGVRVDLELANKTVNPLFAYAYTHDTAGRTGTPFSVFSEKLARHTLTSGVELVIDGASSVLLTVDALLERGDQKKPYRMLPMFAPDVAPTIPVGASLAQVNETRLPGRTAERTPLERNRFALSGRFARRFRAGTVVLADRVYADDWGLVASTTDARLVADVGRRFFVWLHLRGHLQTGVSFWRRAYVAQIGASGEVGVPEYRTGDRELSPLVAGTAGAGVRWNFGRASNPAAWGLMLQADTTETHFQNAIYVRDRVGQLLLVQLEAEL